MLTQSRKFHPISGLWLLSAIAALTLLLPAVARSQETRATPDMKPRPRVPIYDPGAPVLRKVLNPLSPVEAMELLVDKLGKTKNNSEFLNAMQKMG